MSLFALPLKSGLNLQSTVTLRNGVKMPMFGLGTYLIEGKSVKETIKYAVESLGVRHIDTAAFYENEAEIGAAIKELSVPRDQLFITTKLWISSQGYENALAAFEESRRKLQVEYVDLYLIHHPSASHAKNDQDHARLRAESWRALEKLYNEKKVRAIGVSNYNVRHLQMLLKDCNVPPAVNQVEFHPLLTQADLLQFCHQNEIHFEGYSSLAKGNKKLLKNAAVLSAAQSANKTPAQVLLRWVLQKGAVVIPKSSNQQRLRENVELFDFELSDATMKELDSLNENWHCTWTSDQIP
eukprot:TRINITY_DN8797_c0_g1_i1.p1 TRINITY_DN8797_c0_g1~~TRINITY_DN8797_c0_g1_i1.p1  ORF type:complete len:297 (-),score=71.23 TRINITY_DN8797_c0_g1_i1:227-1117(-)